MSDIFVNIYGNGVAYVDNYTPSDGETITLECYEDPGEQLLDVLAWESHGYSVALATTNIQTFTYRAIWGNLTIDVYFSGSTPPPPPPSNWLYAILGSRRRPKTNG